VRHPDNILVEATEVRTHIAALLERGMSRRQVAAQAGVPHSTVAHVMSGQQHWLRQFTAECILGVTYRDPLRLDALGISRRLQALARAGFGAGLIADKLGWSDRYGPLWVRSLRAPRRPTVAQSTFYTVAGLYVTLWDTEGPSKIARRYAVTADWQPFEAWTDRTIDDPRALPYEEAAPEVDLVLIQRFRERAPLYLAAPLRKTLFTDLNHAEQLHVLAEHLATGGSLRGFRDKNRPVPMRLLEELRDEIDFRRSA
jgi:hypothetical protein